MGNRGIYIDDNGQVVVQDLPMPQPADGEVLIQVLYSSVNPTDIKSPKVFGLTRRVLGNEFCGRVLESPNLENLPFKVGDIVAGSTSGSNDRPIRHGTHQSYIASPLAGIFRVPDNLPHADAAALTIVTQTANDAIFNRLGLPLPDTVTAPADGVLVIWGASTSVGMAAVQLARVIGVTSIVAVASAQRHDYLKTLGATHFVDYKDENSVAKVKAILEKAGDGPIWGFDAAGTLDSPRLLLDAMPRQDNIRLTTVLAIYDDKRFDPALGNRQQKFVFDVPGLEKPIVFPARPAEAEVMRKALEWEVNHYGAEYKPQPVKIFEGAAEEAIQEVLKRGEMSEFGKLVLKHPLN